MISAFEFIDFYLSQLLSAIHIRVETGQCHGVDSLAKLAVFSLDFLGAELFGQFVIYHIFQQENESERLGGFEILHRPDFDKFGGQGAVSFTVFAKKSVEHSSKIISDSVANRIQETIALIFQEHRKFGLIGGNNLIGPPLKNPFPMLANQA